jgi:4-amino-4-deoxy-L-arabinose transferase-like glycosyltransferase
VRHASRFGPALALIVLAALGVRLYYVLHFFHGHQIGGDGVEFHLLARTLADTGNYLKPFQWVVDHQRFPTAEKPPLYPAYLAIFAKAGLDSFRWNQIASCLLGAGTVGVIGLIGRRVAGARAGLIAAGVAAIYPMLFLLDGSVRSESLYALLVAIALLCAYRLVDYATWVRAGLLGLVIGLAALTRSEALLLIILLALPAIWLATRTGKLRLALAVIAGCALLVVPWLARNWIAFDRPTAISTNEGGLLLGANCHRAYHGEFIGTWACFPQAPGNNEAAISARFRREAFDYMGDHAGRVPVVMSVRLLRTFEAWDVGDQAKLEAVISDRDLRLDRIGLGFYYVLVVLGTGGAVVLRRRGEPLRLLLAPIVLVAVVAIASYGSTRFRAAAEVPIVILAAVAIDAAVARVSARRRAGSAQPPSPAPAPPAPDPASARQ